MGGVGGLGAVAAFGTFTLAAALLTVTPGLDTALVLRTWLGEGRPAALRAAFGIQAGCLAWGCAVAVGLGAVLAAAPAAYDALRWCGAFYLLACGIQLLVTPRDGLAPAAGTGGRHGAFRRGLLVNLLNPKVGLFYLSFLPGFVPAGWPPAPTIVALSGIHIALALAWFGLLLSGAAAVRTAVTARAGLMRGLNRLTGLVFVGFGLRLALERR